MRTLANRWKKSSVEVVKLPTYCMPTEESSDLVAKRRARLAWMRDCGLPYLGDSSSLEAIDIRVQQVSRKTVYLFERRRRTKDPRADGRALAIPNDEP